MNVVDEYDAFFNKAVNHNLVVNNLVVAVHRAIKGAHHPCKSLNSHFNSGTEPSGGGEEHFLYRHMASSDYRVEPAVASKG